MNRIRDLREDLDLRQIDIAAATGIDQKTLSNYETNKTRPDSESLIKLADYFGVSIDYLVGRATQAPPNNMELAHEINHIQKELDSLKKRLISTIPPSSIKNNR